MHHEVGQDTHRNLYWVSPQTTSDFACAGRSSTPAGARHGGWPALASRLQRRTLLRGGRAAAQNHRLRPLASARALSSPGELLVASVTVHRAQKLPHFRMASAVMRSDSLADLY